MSQPRFTPITSNLLARKGDAVPSEVAPKPSLYWTQDDVSAVTKKPKPAVDKPPLVAKPHRLMVTLSPSEFEILGIAAVKRGVTRHQLLREAFDLHLERLQREFNECDCMMSGGPCLNGCGAG